MSSPAEQELNVEVEVKELEGGQVELQVTVPPEPVQEVREQVLRAFATRANVPGFRKGKAPRALVERLVDQDALKEQIVETLLEKAYEAAIEKAEIEPLNRAQIGDPELGDDWSMTFSATLTRRPSIELGEYKDLKATRRVTKVTDEQVAAELNRVREQRAAFVELDEGTEIEASDYAVVDYDMIVDGEKREDASVQGYPLEVGADQLFAEMNEALPSTKIGGTCEFEVTYPDDHSDESLRGKTATFKVTVKEARRRQLPELDDEFAKVVSDLETMDELRQRVRDNLEAMGTAMADDDVRQQLIRQVTEAAKLDVPESVVGREVDRRIDEVEQELDRRGLTLPQYLQNLQRSFEDWRADIESDARAAARRALVLDEIGSREDTKVTEEEIHEEMHRVAEAQGIKEDEIHERFSESGELNRLITRLYHRKIVQFLVDNAEIAEEEVEPEAESDEPATDQSPEASTDQPEEEPKEE
ncbi:MAG: trigger factor [Armatimonadetes bacterium]|nr:trigger factor [Armatimonadota bacterium]